MELKQSGYFLARTLSYEASRPLVLDTTSVQCTSNVMHGLQTSGVACVLRRYPGMPRNLGCRAQERVSHAGGGVRVTVHQHQAGDEGHVQRGLRRLVPGRNHQL